MSEETTEILDDCSIVEVKRSKSIEIQNHKILKYLFVKNRLGVDIKAKIKRDKDEIYEVSFDPTVLEKTLDIKSKLDFLYLKDVEYQYLPILSSSKTNSEITEMLQMFDGFLKNFKANELQIIIILALLDYITSNFDYVLSHDDFLLNIISKLKKLSLQSPLLKDKNGDNPFDVWFKLYSKYL